MKRNLYLIKYDKHVKRHRQVDLRTIFKLNETIGIEKERKNVYTRPLV